jgi:acetyltransferase-like isoleucine patch superfamily enzyme
MRERFPNSNIHITCTIEHDSVEIGKNTLIGPYCFIRKGTKIGDNCKIGPMNVFEGKGVSVGNHVRMGSHCNLGFGTIIEDYVFFGGHFTGANDNHILWRRRGGEEEFKPQPYTIKRGARIGLGVVLLPGVTVGREAFVGAGSLVTHDVKPYEIVYGHPAKHKGWVETRREAIVE